MNAAFTAVASNPQVQQIGKELIGKVGDKVYGGVGGAIGGLFGKKKQGAKIGRAIGRFGRKLLGFKYGGVVGRVRVRPAVVKM